MHFMGLLLQLAEEDPGSSPAYDALILAAVGIVVVFSALALIGGFIGLLGKVFAEREMSVVSPEVTSAHGMAVGGDIDARTVAVLTAAAMAAVGQPVRLQRITFINRNTVSAWSERGRVSIHASHNVRRSL